MENLSPLSIVSIYGDKHKEGEIEETNRVRKWLGQQIDQKSTENTWVLVEKISRNIPADFSHGQVQFVEKKNIHLIGWDDQESLNRFDECEKSAKALFDSMDLYEAVNTGKADCQSSQYHQLNLLISQVNQLGQKAIKVLNLTNAPPPLPEIRMNKGSFYNAVESTNVLIFNYFEWLISATLPARNHSLAETIVDHSNEDVNAIVGIDHVQLTTDIPEQKKAIDILHKRLKEEEIKFEILTSPDSSYIP